MLQLYSHIFSTRLHSNYEEKYVLYLVVLLITSTLTLLLLIYFKIISLGHDFHNSTKLPTIHLQISRRYFSPFRIQLTQSLNRFPEINYSMEAMRGQLEKLMPEIEVKSEVCHLP